MERKSRENIFVPEGERYRNTIAFVVPIFNLSDFFTTERALEMRKFNRPVEAVVMLLGEI